jgi:hypothetical protein
VALLIALAVMRRVYLDAVPATTLPPDAAAAIFDTFVRFLRDSTRTLIVVAAITALAAYLYGPGRLAVGLRRGARRGAGAAGRGLSRAGLRVGPVGRGLAARRSWATGIVIGAGALALVLWNHPTVGAVVLVLALVLAALAVVAVLVAVAASSPPGDGAASGHAAS